MKIRSLGYRTSFELIRQDGQIIERDKYLVVSSVSNPTYYWGNLLFFKEPPTFGDFAQWSTLFNAEFSQMDEVRHMTFAWDSPLGERGAIEEFVGSGFEFDEAIVLVAPEIAPPKVQRNDIVIRRIESDEDWEKVLESQNLECPPRIAEDDYWRFNRDHTQVQRNLISRGAGFWLGAFLGEQLVGDLGIFAINGCGRFQSVETHPDFRRQGICRILLYDAAQRLRASHGVVQFIVVAEPNYHAIGLYRSVGFLDAQKQVGVCRYPLKN